MSMKTYVLMEEIIVRVIVNLIIFMASFAIANWIVKCISNFKDKGIKVDKRELVCVILFVIVGIVVFIAGLVLVVPFYIPYVICKSGLWLLGEAISLYEEVRFSIKYKLFYIK